MSTNARATPATPTAEIARVRTVFLLLIVSPAHRVKYGRGVDKRETQECKKGDSHRFAVRTERTSRLEERLHQLEEHVDRGAHAGREEVCCIKGNEVPRRCPD